MKLRTILLLTAFLITLCCSRAYCAPLSCPSLADVKTTISKLVGKQEVDGIVAAGITWTAHTKEFFTQEDANSVSLSFNEAKLNPTEEGSIKTAIICRYNTGNVYGGIDFTTRGVAVAVESDHNWAHYSGFYEGIAGDILYCGPGYYYSAATTPNECTFNTF